MAALARLVEEPVLAELLLAEFLRIAPEAGAVVSFCGIARSRAKSGTQVQSLRLEHHPRMTLRSLERIANEGLGRFDVDAVLVVHRHGLILPGEVIVFVAAASAHRRAAFTAADYLMDQLKTEAVFWKKEKGKEAAHWIEPTDADRADAARWDGEGRD